MADAHPSGPPTERTVVDVEQLRQMAAARIAELASDVAEIQARHGRPLDAPAEALGDCARMLEQGLLFASVDRTILSGMASTRMTRAELTPSDAYNAEVAGPLAEAAAILGGLS